MAGVPPIDLTFGLGGVASSIIGAVGAAKQRKLEREQLASQQGANFETAQQQRARLLMDQQTQERTLQTDAYRKALMGALGQNVQDVSFGAGEGPATRPNFNTNVPNVAFSGGLRPSALGTGGKEAAAALRAQAMQALLNPEARPTLDPYQQTVIGSGGKKMTTMGTPGSIMAQQAPVQAAVPRSLFRGGGS